MKTFKRISLWIKRCLLAFFRLVSIIQCKTKRIYISVILATWSKRILNTENFILGTNKVIDISSILFMYSTKVAESLILFY